MKLKSMVLFVAVVAAVAVAAVMWSGDAVRVSHAQETGSDVVARVGETEITMTAVDEYAKRTNSKVYQDLFDARNRALNEMIAEKLLLAEAASRGITPDELVKQEIVEKVAAVSDADIESFFKENSARMGGRTLDQMKDQIRSFLTSQNQSTARSTFIDGLRAKGKVAVMLDPPRAEIQIAGNDPKMGPDGAAVRIVEFSDFQ